MSDARPLEGVPSEVGHTAAVRRSVVSRARLAARLERATQAPAHGEPGLRRGLTW